MQCFGTLAYLTARYWGLRTYGTLFGTILSALAASNAAGPLIAARLFDAEGSYRSFLTFAVCSALALAFLLFASLPAHSRAEKEAH